MVFFNHATRQMTAKIVYYGPGLCGKTTNLNTIYGKTSQKARGEMVSLNTETDRTLFFDLLPMDVGMVGGFKTKLQLYTVPGQVFYNSTRKLVLKGVDGIVFVVDSQTPMFDACRESYQNLEENLRELGLQLGDIPTVFQWNKRDLRNVVPVEELEATFNPKGAPSFQSVASDGSGVFETLRGITKLALFHIKTHVLGEGQAEPAPAPVPVAEPSRFAAEPPRFAAEPPRSAAEPPRSAAEPPRVVAEPSRAVAEPSHAAAEPPHGAVEALTLSDLPSVTDLLDMEDSSYASVPGAAPLPDEDDDTGFFIEAPALPDHPGAVDDDISFLMGDEELAPPAAEPEHAALPEPAMEALEPSNAPAPEVFREEPAPPPAPAPPPPVPQAHVPKAQAPIPQAPVHQPPVQAKPAAKVDPLAALASLKVEAKRPPIKAKPVDSKDAINSLMGELTQVGRTGAPSVLRLEVPALVDGQEIEVVVQLRCRGEVVAEGQIQRPAPVKGITAKLSVEMKRS